MRPGRVVVMDNLGAHKGERVRELVEARGCSLLFLAPYSPDFSPIEEAFSKVRAILRKAAARERGTLVEAIGRALWAVSARRMRGAGSATAATRSTLNLHEHRCQTVNESFEVAIESRNLSGTWTTFGIRECEVSEQFFGEPGLT